MEKTEKAFNLLMKVKEYFSRKFLLACVCLALGYHLTLNDKGIGDWAMLVGVVLAFYNGANVTEKYAELRSTRMTLIQKETADGKPD